MKWIDRNIFKGNTKLRSAALGYLVAVLIHNFPILVAWLPADSAKAMQSIAYVALQGLPGMALWWGKQHNLSGLGTPELPLTKAHSDGTITVKEPSDSIKSNPS